MADPLLIPPDSPPGLARDAPSRDAPGRDALARAERAERARRNGARSRGPRTEAGKARASRNALRHGLCARVHVVLEPEDAAAFAGLSGRLLAELAPDTALGGFLAARLAAAMWQTGRAERLEAQAFDHHAVPDPDRLQLALRYRGSVSRELLRTLRELRLLHRQPRQPATQAVPPHATPTASHADASQPDTASSPLPPRAGEGEGGGTSTASIEAPAATAAAHGGTPIGADLSALAAIAWGGPRPAPVPPGYVRLLPVPDTRPLSWSFFQYKAFPGAEPLLVYEDGTVRSPAGELLPDIWSPPPRPDPSARPDPPASAAASPLPDTGPGLRASPLPDTGPGLRASPRPDTGQSGLGPAQADPYHHHLRVPLTGAAHRPGPAPAPASPPSHGWEPVSRHGELASLDPDPGSAHDPDLAPIPEPESSADPDTSAVPDPASDPATPPGSPPGACHDHPPGLAPTPDRDATLTRPADRPIAATDLAARPDIAATDLAAPPDIAATDLAASRYPERASGHDRSPGPEAARAVAAPPDAGATDRPALAPAAARGAVPVPPTAPRPAPFPPPATDAAIGAADLAAAPVAATPADPAAPVAPASPCPGASGSDGQPAARPASPGAATGLPVRYRAPELLYPQLRRPARPARAVTSAPAAPPLAGQAAGATAPSAPARPPPAVDPAAEPPPEPPPIPAAPERAAPAREQPRLAPPPADQGTARAAHDAWARLWNLPVPAAVSAGRDRPRETVQRRDEPRMPGSAAGPPGTGYG